MTARRLCAYGIGASIALGLSGCQRDGPDNRFPTELAQTLPEMTLVYPGAALVRQYGTDAYCEVTELASERRSFPASMALEYQVSSPVEVRAAIAWYQKQLTAAGYTMRKDAGGLIGQGRSHELFGVEMDSPNSDRFTVDAQVFDYRSTC